MNLARAYGQPPHIVALWPQEWLGAAMTALAAETGAANERAKRDARKQKMAAMMSGSARRRA